MASSRISLRVGVSPRSFMSFDGTTTIILQPRISSSCAITASFSACVCFMLKKHSAL